jgi:uncharacterized OsmC-like protein
MASEDLRETLERNARAVALRPSIGQRTSRTRVRLQPGLACTISEGRWTLTAGVGEKGGGSDAGPSPGVLGRGALGSCLAVGYAGWAARLGVEIDSLEVVVEADYDTRGELGVSDDVIPGYQQVRYIVHIASRAPAADVQRVLDAADKYSPYRDIFSRAIDLRREVHITTLAPADAAAERLGRDGG